MELDLGFMYAIEAFIAMISNTIILNRTRATAYKETIDKWLSLLLFFFVVFSLVDGIWGLFFSRILMISRLGLEIFTYGFHIMAAFSAFMWATYLVHYLELQGFFKRLINIFKGVLIVFQVCFILSNIFTHAAFVINENAEYVTGAQRSIYFYLQFAYYVLLNLVTFALLAKNWGKGRKYVNAIIYSLIPLIAGIAQRIYPDGPMYSVGFMLTGIAIYSFNVTAQREEFFAEKLRTETSKLSSIVGGLSGDFQIVYYIDLDSGKYEKLSHSDFYKNDILNSVKESDFFEKVEIMAKTVHPEDADMIREYLSKSYIRDELKQRESFSFNYRIFKDGAYRYNMLKVIRSDLEGEENQVIIGVFDDDERVTAEKEQQEALRTARLEAEAANEAKSRFLFNMSHDIRTPMNAILGFANMAQKHIDDKSVVTDSLSKVSTAGNYLLSLINEVLDIARIESGNLELDESPMCIADSTDMIVSIMTESAKSKGLGFHYTNNVISRETVFCDRLHLEQVLMNIISNAIKYTRPGGDVFFNVDRLADSAENHASYRFTVRDTGVGMSEEFISHIFEDFSRAQSATKSGIEGTGLGMAIVKRLLDKMGGTIDIRSRLGEGSEVVIDVGFLLFDSAYSGSNAEFPEVPAVAEADSSEVNLAGRRILLVEDNELNREIARDILDDFSILVEEADDGSVAVEMLKKAGPTYYDAVLMDIQMPYMDGYTATKAIRAFPDEGFAKLPIIAMTANAFEEDRQNAFAAGMNAHLGKPINFDELALTLKKCIRERG